MTKRKAIYDIIMTIIFFILCAIVSFIGIYSVIHGEKLTFINIIAITCTCYTVVNKFLDIWNSWPDYVKALTNAE